MGQGHSRDSDRLQRRTIPQPVLTGQLRQSPAWLISIFFHITLFTTLAALWTTRSSGTGQEAGGPIGIAVVYESADGEEFYVADAGEDAGGGEMAAALASLPSESQMGATQASDLLAGLLPTGSANASELLAGAGNLGLGDGRGELGGDNAIPKVKTTVFGIEGEGTRFVYVFDRSDSMNGFQGKPLAMAKSELISSLESLGRLHEFQVIFYNDSPLPFGGFQRGSPGLMRGDDASKLQANRFIRDISAIGGTHHIDALRMALGMNPDVAFFLTDADFPAPSNSEIEDIQSRAARSGTTIHTIQFGSGPSQGAGGWIQRLAEGTLGKFRYVDVSKF